MFSIFKQKYFGLDDAGKTSMMLSFMADRIPVDYTPTALDTFKVDVKVGEEVLTLDITDTAGQDEFEK